MSHVNTSFVESRKEFTLNTVRMNNQQLFNVCHTRQPPANLTVPSDKDASANLQGGPNQGSKGNAIHELFSVEKLTSGDFSVFNLGQKLFKSCRYQEKWLNK